MTVTLADMADWHVLSVCGTCYYFAAGGDEIHSDSDAASMSALELGWHGYHIWPDCSGDGCEAEHLWKCVTDGGCDDELWPTISHEHGHHAGGFTHSACDVCGVHGRDDYRVIAEPMSPEALQTDAAQSYIWGWSPHGLEHIPAAVSYLNHLR